MSAMMQQRASAWLLGVWVTAWALGAACGAQANPPKSTTPTKSATATKQQPAPGKARVRGVLFKFESTTATVYLLGSVHVANQSLYPLDKRIYDAFDGADTLVLETELTPTAKARSAKLLQQAGMLTPPDTLDAHLDDGTRAALHAALAERNIPVQAVQAMRPWLASLTLTIAQLGAQGFRPEFGIDEHFRSRGARKHLTAIETVEQQVAVFQDMPEDTQLSSLRQTLEQLGELDQMIEQALAAWRSGDATALDTLLLAPMRKDFPALYRRLFTERNKRMTDAIAGYLEGSGTVFVVVGAGHLVGPESVVQMLKRRGLPGEQL